MSKNLFEPFSVGDVKVIDRTPNDEPPSKEDTIAGRYASVLFSSASKEGALYQVYEDMKFVSEMYSGSEDFKLLTENSTLGMKEITLIRDTFSSLGGFSPVTLNFINVLGENNRFMFIASIAEKYLKLYQQFNKEEKITIISPTNLSQTQQSQVLEALKQNPKNAGKEFVLEFQIDENLIGGLQMYTESEFLDMSLSSRLEKLNQEVQKLID